MYYSTFTCPGIIDRESITITKGWANSEVALKREMNGINCVCVGGGNRKLGQVRTINMRQFLLVRGDETIRRCR